MRAFSFWIFAIVLISRTADAELPEGHVGDFVRSNCLSCHSDNTDTRLDLSTLGSDLAEPATFRSWVSMFDRMTAGEMPPASEPRPDRQQLKNVLKAVRSDLLQANRQRQTRIGRTPARRLTKLELSYTLQDILGIHGQVTSAVPDESESGSFDTVGVHQRISSIHMQSYLKTADEALNQAIQLQPNPYQHLEFDFVNNQFMNAFHDLPLNQGGSVTTPRDGGVAMFIDADYLTRATNFGFFVKAPGLYRITSQVGAVQSRRTVTAKLILRDRSGAASLLKAVDIQPGKPETFSVTTFLGPGDDFYLTMNLGMSQEDAYAALAAAGGAKSYKGPGILLLHQSAEGPLWDAWPPGPTRRLLAGLELDGGDSQDEHAVRVVTAKPAIEHIRECIAELAPRVFRRPVVDGELDRIVKLAEDAVEGRQKFENALRLPLRAMFASPQFLLFHEQPGPLSDHAIACRLSYFLWKSTPDKRLFSLADAGQLSDPKVLAAETDRLLDDARSRRFVDDFVGQWLRLYKVNATSPDKKLFPEYDEVLNDSIPRETQSFFAELIKHNLGVDRLIDSDFVMVNSRLAQHYQLDDVSGQAIRRVALASDSPRGGVLTQAAILKTTANGSVTSPVTRGNFVLSNILGTPPPPPPANVGNIDPDTQGKTSIRELLAAHRDSESCMKCHRLIDPPGFALECFDPVGAYRKFYPSSTWERMIGMAPVVDAAGVMADGSRFADITEFKRLLMKRTDEVARNLVAKLVVYSTGAEIQFADRRVIDEMTEQLAEEGYPVRRIVHAVVQSPLFLHK